nr:MAG TPA: hypothetical protein [Caudoviricetes sp.]
MPLKGGVAYGLWLGHPCADFGHGLHNCNKKRLAALTFT